MEDSSYCAAPYSETPMYEQDTQSAYPPYPSYPSFARTTIERVVYVERRKPPRQCCCCFPLVSGVYLLLIINILLAVFSMVIGGMGLATGKSRALFAILALSGMTSFIILLIAFIGLSKWNPKLYAYAPAHMIFTVMVHVGTAVFGFLVGKPETQAKYKNDLSPFTPTARNEKEAAALALIIAYSSIFNCICGIYYSYVMVRLYKVIKKEPKNQQKKLEDVPY